ncbi:peptide deformylase [Campylobacter fetus]|uniref:Peptide deformylase n=2 Tax=Campylobacter fetus TaxID=196 RepID=A0AAX0HBB1_CAMFE|nr:peptide deformylase [Campylobacter fetus]AGZ82479.1 peptide deformylase [Campylobacter fetus subsp. testudinum 03-427]AJB46198.1 peptide deformylase [Campylobacter fetus subsp. testudinum]ALV65647.1 peptide deformylase [Campylobacter fetus subsp. testudinum Sp3]AVK81888.1 peptide deformylase [Campylobacter fetus subsp. testudinum]EAI4322574.1 peptide deformylase [Campylobacter fetus]
MVLDVITYPDKRLFEKSVDVVKFDDELAKFLDDMYDTMIAKNGIGLAAIQVGRPIRVFIINLINEDEIQDKNDLLEIINPKFISKCGEIVYQEGCLSVPGYYEDVKRAKDIKIQFQDRFGNLKELEADGLLSVAIQHENDHLDGRLFIEKIGFNKRKKFDKEYKKKSKLKPI